MPQGPLIPGMREFDRPRGRWPAWLRWSIVGAVAALLVLLAAGFVGAVGPFRALGLRTVPLEAVAYRATIADDVIQVGVAMPANGLCRGDEISVVAFERGVRVELETSLTRGRGGSCESAALGGDLRWVDVALDGPLASRSVVRLPDRQAVPQRQGASLG